MKSKPFAHFPTLRQEDIPRGRNGKHKVIVSQILEDLEKLGVGKAIRIPLGELGDTKEKIRAALNRATRKRGLIVSTAADSGYLYVWAKGETDSAA